MADCRAALNECRVIAKNKADKDNYADFLDCRLVELC